uniref:Uncharacterized protein n=1 Tax=Meloidogyne hapla TaxID=6305 RepID=A0A1I8B1V7_MELHA
MVTTNILIKPDKQQQISASCSLLESLESALDEFTKLKIEGDCKIPTDCKTMRRTGLQLSSRLTCKYSLKRM